MSIGKALSIQTHPDKAAACALNIIAPDKYPDDNHKPEIAIAFTELKALAGLKNKREIKKLLEDYPVFTSVLEGQPGVSLNNEEQFTDAERGTLYNSILFIETEKLEKVISQILKLIKEKSNPEYIEEVFLREFEEYGFDPGLLALFFFNLVHLKKGEAFFTPAGVPHAYLCGDIVECMATSDNVVRAGLTPKFKDIDTLVKILDTSYTAPNILQPEAKNMFGYKTPAEEFSLSRVLTQDSEQINLDTSGKIKTILLLSGKIILKTNGERFSYHNGDSFILPAEVGKYRMITTENTELFIVDIP